ncbi:hypothetical protein TRIATDRAFT_94120 [Trichoderma atroviride IMI 206040]|uniref:Uncharacterized protein n=1 Tax=Hypocrea atroviridis (strain ATCC 20476 / IMI 206040) TaxID=452589 RepID=G9NEX1_HYPAI|nr:uncharacterized protein TRIATDRAFT_94120 [Trichoderma atroviride IMI 206040]EHK50852.1 hypothetical protein TRIATDRAFT_94120 [Trichoderma atroviride IMI 206040]
MQLCDSPQNKGARKKNSNNSKEVEHRPEKINRAELDDDSTFPVQQFSDEESRAQGRQVTHPILSCISSTAVFTADPSRRQVQIRTQIPTLPDFLAADQFNKHLEKIRSGIAQANLASELTPLLPRHIATRLIQNSFAEIMEDRQLLDLAGFTALLSDQYIASSTGPAGNFARWAIVNAMTALALRFKAAPGSEADLSSIPLAFYHNATAVIHQLILQEPSLLSIQALLAMAMFVEDTPESTAFIMLGTNASRQLELFNRKMPEDFKSNGTKSKQHQRIGFVEMEEDISFLANFKCFLE